MGEKRLGVRDAIEAPRIYVENAKRFLVKLGWAIATGATTSPRIGLPADHYRSVADFTCTNPKTPIAKVFMLRQQPVNIQFTRRADVHVAVDDRWNRELHGIAGRIAATILGRVVQFVC